MIFYRTGQSWLPRKLDSLEPGKLVLFMNPTVMNQKSGSKEIS